MSFKTSLLFIAAAGLGLTAVAHASPIASPDIDSNGVTLSFSYLPVTSIDWDGTLEVTAGEQYSSPPTISESWSGDNTVWTITLLADRSDSSPIATDFINDSGGFYNVFSPYALLSFPPSQLNFFFGLDVCTANGNIGCFTIYLGQGSNIFGQNNWWFGSQNITGILGQGDNEVAQLSFGGGATVNTSSGGNDHSFDLMLLPSVSAIPEPASFALLVAGLTATLAGARSSRRRRNDLQQMHNQDWWTSVKPGTLPQEG